MKLKYYMRGLGIGICLTTILLSFGNEKMTDQEIIQRAEKLGMKSTKETDDELHNALDKMKVTLTPVPTPSVEPTKAPTPKPTAEPTKEPTKAPTKKPTPTTKPVAVSFSIKKGMTSDSVAQTLKDAGLIKNADSFNDYIINKGKASVIRVGYYSITKGASYDEIIRRITK